MKDLAPELATERVATDFLRVAPENPRSAETLDEEQLQELAISIAANGLYTPMIGYWQGVNFYVTAGGRRVRAIQHLAETTVYSEQPDWPVIVMTQEDAVHAGNAEQISHVALDEADELRLFTMPAYAGLADHELGDRLGRSARYVAQRREILGLPEDMLDAVFRGAISVDQGIGLTFAKEYPETRAEFFERAKRDPGFDSGDMRNHLSKMVKAWSDYCFAQLVTHDEYREAGGRLQQDLFTNNPLVLDPHILVQLATEAARDQMADLYGDRRAFVRELDEGENLYELRKHNGVYGLTDDEAAEYRRLDWWGMRQLQQAAEPDEETGEFDHDAVAALEAAVARKEELEPRAIWTYPEDLERLLGVAWKLNDGSVFDYNGTKRDPIKVVDHVLPKDLEPLYEAGYLERPTDAPTPAPEPVAPEDKITNTLRLYIDRIRAHTLRMELSKTPDNVIRLFTAHLAAKLGRTVGFSVDPEPAQHPDPELEVTFTPQWEKMKAAANATPDEVGDMSDKTVREILAYRILSCLTTRHPLAATQHPAIIRKYWTPSAAFLRSYNKVQLTMMVEDLAPGEDVSTQKRDGLAEIVANLAAKRKDWLPFGFCERR
ncbi:ParB/RepB/Spo0J family partition protein [Tabrizicola sp. BL-A-41-H6]|uniref:ParB/RepB/Spo0J family partition protein n=1 Tax=Tabrizicola sp. BL-A-41-H6 TaxID=3421107 RepID=UPI003D663D5F